MEPRHVEPADQVREEWASSEATADQVHDEWAGTMSGAERWAGRRAMRQD